MLIALCLFGIQGLIMNSVQPDNIKFCEFLEYDF